jgi:hypothetical protein
MTLDIDSIEYRMKKDNTIYYKVFMCYGEDSIFLDCDENTQNLSDIGLFLYVVNKMRETESFILVNYEESAEDGCWINGTRYNFEDLEEYLEGNIHLSVYDNYSESYCEPNELEMQNIMEFHYGERDSISVWSKTWLDLLLCGY